jgi:hypothetical protein
MAFAERVSIPEQAIRNAFRCAIDRLMVKVEDAPDAVAEEDPEERTAVIAEMLAGAGSWAIAVPKPHPANR